MIEIARFEYMICTGFEIHKFIQYPKRSKITLWIRGVGSKMIKAICLFNLIAIFGFCHSGIAQTKKSLRNNKERTSAIIQKMRIHLEKFHGLRTISKPELYYNSIERILDLHGDQIPIDDVNVLYVYNKQTEKDSVKYGKMTPHFIKFRCIIEYCFGGNENFNAISKSFPFKTKIACYQFIELINELKNI